MEAFPSINWMYYSIAGFFDVKWKRPSIKFYQRMIRGGVLPYLSSISRCDFPSTQTNPDQRSASPVSRWGNYPPMVKIPVRWGIFHIEFSRKIYGGFLKYGYLMVPLNHPFFDGIFHYKPPSYWASRYLWKPHFDAENWGIGYFRRPATVVNFF